MGEKKQSPKGEPKSSGAAKPVSLRPLTFEESIDSIFAVPPPPKDEVKAKAEKKRAANKRR